MIYAFGAYGTNNLGDDAIFLGLQSTANDRVIQVYINRPSILDSICYDQITKETFTKKDILIIGGGGLLHCKGAVEDYLRLAQYAKEAGAKVYIRKIGTEGLKPDFANEAKQLFALADSASVRSKKSLEYLAYNSIPNGKVKLEKDYVYDLKFKGRIHTMELKESLKSHFDHPEWPLIGLVTAGNGAGIETVSWIVSKLLLDDVQCNIVHVPHSRAYVSTQNNDVVTGELIWSSINIYHARRFWRYMPLPMASTPYALYDIYTQLDGVIGYRYHSFIFSQLTKTPLLGMVHGDKALAFFNEEQYGDFIFSNRTKEELLEKCKSFILNLKTNGK